MKLRDGVTKYTLREALRPLLPSEVLTQKKAGFGAPSDTGLPHDLQPMIEDLLNEAALRRRGLLVPGAVRQLVNEHRSAQQDWSLQIWQFLTLELWMRTFMDLPEIYSQRFSCTFPSPIVRTHAPSDSIVLAGRDPSHRSAGTKSPLAWDSDTYVCQPGLGGHGADGRRLCREELAPESARSARFGASGC